MKISVGPSLTERQERQREAIYEAPKVLSAAGYEAHAIGAAE